jgi:hypothetical protein
VDTAAEVFFGQVVKAAVEERKLDTSDETQIYLVSLLSDHARKPQLHQVDEPFGMRLARAMHTTGGERFHELRSLGDDVLFISGFYSDYLERRGLPLDYVSGLGSVAYSGVASILRSHANRPVVFDELSGRFQAFVGLLQHVADSLMAESLGSEGKGDPSDLLNVYERWSRTGSKVLAEALIRMGVMPGRGRRDLN